MGLFKVAVFGSFARLDASLRLSGRVGGLRLRGEARFALAGDSGFRESKITGEWRGGEKSEWKVDLGYSADDKRARVAFGHTRRFRKFALTGQVEAASDGSVAAGLSLAFSRTRIMVAFALRRKNSLPRGRPLRLSIRMKMPMAGASLANPCTVKSS